LVSRLVARQEPFGKKKKKKFPGPPQKIFPLTLPARVFNPGAEARLIVSAPNGPDDLATPIAVAITFTSPAVRP